MGPFDDFVALVREAGIDVVDTSGWFAKGTYKGCYIQLGKGRRRVGWSVLYGHIGDESSPGWPELLSVSRKGAGEWRGCEYVKGCGDLVHEVMAYALEVD